MSARDPLHRPLRRLLQPFAVPFSRTIAAIDERVGADGLAAGTAWGLERLTGRVVVAGWDAIPRAGPLLVCANHPGLSDTLALMASIPRPDLRIIAAETAFLRALPNIGRHLALLPDRPDARRAASRDLAAHLGRGGALLAFPRGEIEPDPERSPAAADSLDGWSRGIGVFVRMAPRTVVVPANVRGVLSPKAMRHPLVGLRRSPRGREQLAASLQVVVRAYQLVTVRVAFGRPLPGSVLLEGGADARRVTSRIVQAARQLLSAPRDDWETLVEWAGAGRAQREGPVLLEAGPG